MSLTSYQAAPPCIKGMGNVLVELQTVKMAFLFGLKIAQVPGKQTIEWV